MQMEGGWGRKEWKKDRGRKERMRKMDGGKL